MALWTHAQMVRAIMHRSRDWRFATSGAPSASIDCHSLPTLGNRDLRIQIDVLDRIEQRDAFGHRALKRFASADQAHATAALINHRRADCFRQVASTA